MKEQSVFSIKPLDFTWETSDPFLFCVHHDDNFPAGNDRMGPAESLKGRDLGNDFTVMNGWRMYHGEKIPGFPAHPHRGFETITIVLKGFIDHTDSLGGAGRYGNGDVQWMTAGSGLQHAEMFPLLNRDAGNPLELFQIWMNLPKAKKHVKPYYGMIWSEDIPKYTEKDKNGRVVEIDIIAGRIGNVIAPEIAPDSWASDPDNGVGIWLIKLEANAQWNIPVTAEGINRTLFFYRGKSLHIEGVNLDSEHSFQVDTQEPVLIENGSGEARLLILQGKPLNEPVVQHGPFVMNTFAEIQQTFSDFQKTRFGGWPWPDYDYVHPREKGRFAKYSDGREEVR